MKDVARTCPLAQAPERTRRFASFLAILLLAGLLGTVPVAAAAAEGPGPFANVRLTAKGLLLTLKGSATPLSGEPRVEVSDGGPWVPFDRRATIQSAGAQLLQRGSVAGVPVAGYFPQNQTRRIRVRDGSGGETELDVVRQGDGFLLAWTNRTPAKAKRRATNAPVTFDALADRSLTVRPDAGEDAVIDVVVAATLPPLPENAASQIVLVFADGPGTGEVRSPVATYPGDGPVSIQHLLLPAGEYRLRTYRVITYGNGLSYSTSRFLNVPLDDVVTVSPEHRTLSVTIPDSAVAPPVAATVRVDGIAALEPSNSNRLTVGLTLTSLDAGASYFSDQSVTTDAPLVFDVRVPPGMYRVDLSAGTSTTGLRSSSTTVGFGTFAFPADLNLTVPPLATFRGAILDPDFALFTDPQNPADAINRVQLGAAPGEPLPFSGVSTLFGFTRSFSMRAPAGRRALVFASFQLDAGRRDTPNTNHFAQLDVAVSDEPVTLDGDVELDVRVPALPPFVTVTGSAVDRRGKARANAYILATSSDVEGLPGSRLTAATTANTNGAFTLRVLPGRAYQLNVYAPADFSF